VAQAGRERVGGRFPHAIRSKRFLTSKNLFPDTNHRENLGIGIKRLLKKDFVLK
jgi:hypothetical protein